jgi:hypothetical protein
MRWINDEVRDAISNSHRATWFALFSTTTTADYMFINGVQHGNFRLHPVGRGHISEGCITLASEPSFDQLSAFLRSQPAQNVPGTQIRYYGTVTVK